MSRIESFLDLYNSESTINAYKSTLKKYFFFFHEGTKEEFSLEEAEEKYFSEERDYQTDVKAFYTSVKDKPPKSVRMYLSIIRTFFEENNIELSSKFWKRIKNRNGPSRARTVDRIPTREELKQILNHCPIRARAFYLMLSSSGMRIGEASQITLSDIDIECVPAEVHLRAEYTKTKVPRTAFISSEAVQLLKDWLKIRDKFIETHVKSTEYSAKVFPVRTAKLGITFKVAVTRAKLDQIDPSTKRRVIHPHTLRKYVRTNLAKAIQADMVEAIVGHENNSSESYRRYSIEEMREAYLAGEHMLSIYTDASLIQKEIEEKTSELKSTVTSIVGKSLTMESEMAELKRSNEKLMELVARLMADIRRDEVQQSMSLLTTF